MPHPISPPPKEDPDLRPYFWKFALLLITMFLFFRVGFKGPDYPIYPAYLDSIFQDGDLNLINNLAPQDPKKSCGEELRGVPVTRTYNNSDFHNNGSAILWAPFYMYGKGLAALSGFLLPGNHAPDLAVNITVCSLAYSTVVMGYLSCLMIFIISSRFFSARSAFWSTLVIFWGTPAFYYTLIENGNANIPAIFTGVLLLLATPPGLTSEDWRPAVILGSLYALCVAIKIDLYFQIFMILATAVVFRFSGKLRPRNLLYAFLGFLGAGIPRLINEYIKSGGFHSSEAGIVNLGNSYHLQQLFSPFQGFLVSSPVLIICLTGLFLLIWTITTNSNRQNLFFAPDQAVQRIILVMSIWLGAKLFIIGFRFAWGGGTFGARQLLTELPYFVLLINFLISQNRFQKPWLRLLLPVTLGIAILLNFVHAGEYYFDKPMSYYLNPPSLVERITYLRFLAIVSEKSLMQFPLKLTTAPLLLLTLWLAWVLLSRSREINFFLAPWGAWTKQSVTRTGTNSLHHYLNGLVACMLFIWIIITGMNLINNRANVEVMAKQGCFDFVVVVPPNWFELTENMFSMNEMIQYYKQKGDLQEVEHIKSVCKILYPDMYDQLAK